jgi:hypothetical protein
MLVLLKIVNKLANSFYDQNARYYVKAGVRAALNNQWASKGKTLKHEGDRM